MSDHLDRGGARHVAGITDSFADPRPFGECSCGWEGPKRKTQQEARVDVEQHYREVERDA